MSNYTIHKAAVSLPISSFGSVASVYGSKYAWIALVLPRKTISNPPSRIYADRSWGYSARCPRQDAIISHLLATNLCNPSLIGHDLARVRFPPSSSGVHISSSKIWILRAGEQALSYAADVHGILIAVLASSASWYWQGFAPLDNACSTSDSSCPSHIFTMMTWLRYSCRSHLLRVRVSSVQS